MIIAISNDCWCNDCWDWTEGGGYSDNSNGVDNDSNGSNDGFADSGNDTYSNDDDSDILVIEIVMFCSENRYMFISETA